jgi:hypothetical protein
VPTVAQIKAKAAAKAVAKAITKGAAKVAKAKRATKRRLAAAQKKQNQKVDHQTKKAVAARSVVKKHLIAVATAAKQAIAAARETAMAAAKQASKGATQQQTKANYDAAKASIALMTKKEKARVAAARANGMAILKKAHHDVRKVGHAARAKFEAEKKHAKDKEKQAAAEATLMKQTAKNQASLAKKTVQNEAKLKAVTLKKEKKMARKAPPKSSHKKKHAAPWDTRSAKSRWNWKNMPWLMKQRESRSKWQAEEAVDEANRKAKKQGPPILHQVGLGPCRGQIRREDRVTTKCQRPTWSHAHEAHTRTCCCCC